MLRVAALLLVTASLLTAGPVLAAPDDDVSRLLATGTPPPGVVFEVVSGDEAALERALPAIDAQARRLRERWPGLPVAVVTHGSEQFSLLTANASRHADLHALAATLVDERHIAVEVCGNHASFRGNGREDFPDWVTVVSAASSRLAQYRDAGYVIIVR